MGGSFESSPSNPLNVLGNWDASSDSEKIPEPVMAVSDIEWVKQTVRSQNNGY
jgi:hypothetical protein